MDGLLLDPHMTLAEEATLSALLRCCVRELAGPRGQVGAAEPYLLLRVAGTDLRVRAHGGIALRFDGAAEWLGGGSWRPLTSDLLVDLVERELEGGNEEFGAQVAASRGAIAMLIAARRQGGPPADPWLASEQALVTGHPFHPSPKARTGPGWLSYAPEAHAEFPLRLLGVRADLAAGQGDTGALDRLGTAPRGYVLLPAHPWQLELLATDLRGPLGDGRLVDLGYGSRPAIPTSSVRTVYEPVTGVCLKFSLDVRITNCVRKNAWYELIGAVELTQRLHPVFERLADRFPGTGWLPEPGYRSAALGNRLLEGLGVIVRSGPWSACGPGVTPVLAGALANSPYGPARRAQGGTGPTGGVPEAVHARRSADPVTWWKAYAERVALPVLDAYFRHGVALEPHLQNVLVGVDSDGLPVEAIFRDMEGTKLVAGQHDLSGLPRRVAEAITYEADRGWTRVAYCLIVNHLAEIAATVAESAAHGPRISEAGPPRLAAADANRVSAAGPRGGWATASRAEGILGELWATAREVVARYAGEYGEPPPLLAELLAGTPLAAKANLAVRWARSADSAAGYVTVANPIAACHATIAPLDPAGRMSG